MKFVPQLLAKKEQLSQTKWNQQSHIIKQHGFTEKNECQRHKIAKSKLSVMFINYNSFAIIYNIFFFPLLCILQCHIESILIVLWNSLIAE